ncbi:MAG: hypothetical protein AAF633_18610, partial [Chloroflexota bacterium]
MKRTFVLIAALMLSLLFLFFGSIGGQIFALLALLLFPTLLWQPYVGLKGVESWVVTFGLIVALNIVASLI